MTTTTGLDSVAVLAMMSAVNRRVLATQPDTESDLFLAFPLGPLPFRAEDLRFDPPGGRDASQAQMLAELSELANRIPTRSALWVRHGSEHLWDVYGAVLDAELAPGRLSPSDTARRDAALATLYVTGPAGQSPSPTLIAYLDASRRYRAALAAYRLAGNGDPAQVAALEADVQTAAVAWATTGHRSEVEAALDTVASLVDLDPSIWWHTARENFDPSEPASFMVTPDGLRFAPTFFSPSSAVEDGAVWPRVELDEAALTELSADSTIPEDLREALGGSAGDVSAVGFDYFVVDLVRNWLPEGMFTSRAYRFSSGQVPLYDPDVPEGNDQCPALVTGLVLARDITITSSASSGSALGPFDTSSMRDLEASGGATAAGLRGIRDATLQQAVQPPGRLGFPITPATSVAGLRRVDDTHDPIPDLPDDDPGGPVIGNPPPPIDPTRTVSTDPGLVLLVAFACRAMPTAPNPDPELFAEPPGPVTPPRTHTVVKGETLWSIAVAAYHDGHRYVDIVAANQLSNPNAIAVGQVLVLP